MRYLLTALLGLSLTCHCAAQHSDIQIDVRDGQLLTRPRIAEGEFGEAPNPGNVAEEPGFEVEAGSFLAGATLEFNALSLSAEPADPTATRRLWFWDGLAPVSFSATDDVLTVQHPVLPTSLVVDSTLGAQTTPGFLIGIADAEGGLHQDLEFVLGNNPPADGIYLFGLQMTSDSYLPSEALYVVLASGVDEVAHEMAVDWVADTFGVPEPSSWTLLALVGVLGLSLVRRM